MTLGKPNFFDIDKYLDCCEGMILADEVERAFWMLDNAPAWYRDNPPERLREIKQSLHQAMFTAVEYAEADRECGMDFGAKLLDRGEPVFELVKKLNREGIKPHLMELAPGSFWLANALKKMKCEFTEEYRSIKLNGSDPAQGPVIFVAFELIEHLQNENELYQAYLKFNRKAQHIFISTPLYTYAGGMNQWRGQALGHLRAYTPKEFQKVVTGMFEGYDWKHYLNEDCTQVLVGERV